MAGRQDTEIVIYCGTGHRSTIAMTIMWSYGYTNVRSMKGGLGPLNGSMMAIRWWNLPNTQYRSVPALQQVMP
jgi:hypothetical protein